MPGNKALFMRTVWWALFFAYSAFAQIPEKRPAPEPRTWTFCQDGKIDTQSGVWSFKKGGRIDARFVRLIGTNVVEVKLALNGKQGRLTITDLSDEDCVYLASISGQPISSRLNHQLSRPAKPPASDLVQTKFDDTTGQTTYLPKQPILLGPAGDPRTLNLQAYILADVPDFVAIHFTSRCPADLGWQYLTDRHISFVFEDRKKDCGEPKRLGTTGDGYLLEQFTPRCKLAEFKEIASAEHVEVRLGHEAFKLSYESRAAWRALVALVEAQRSEVNQ